MERGILDYSEGARLMDRELNRSERRRREREAKKAEIKYELTARQIKEIGDKAYKQAYEDGWKDTRETVKKQAKVATGSALTYLVGVSLKAGVDMFHWSRKTCTDYVLKMVEVYNDCTFGTPEAMMDYINTHAKLDLVIDDEEADMIREIEEGM